MRTLRISSALSAQIRHSSQATSNGKGAPSPRTAAVGMSGAVSGMRMTVTGISQRARSAELYQSVRPAPSRYQSTISFHVWHLTRVRGLGCLPGMKIPDDKEIRDLHE